jgi:hypothetical protein
MNSCLALFRLLALIAVMFIYGCGSGDAQRMRYEETEYEQFQSMNNQVSLLYSTFLNQNINDNSNKMIRTGNKIVDSINHLISRINAIPRNISFHDEINKVDEILFGSGDIDRIEADILAFILEYGDVNYPPTSMLIIRDYKAHGVLIPWKNILFYHALRKDAVILF